MACVFGSPYAFHLIACRRSNGVLILRKFFVRLTVLPLQGFEIIHPVFEISITLQTQLPNGSRWHLAAQATMCEMGTQTLSPKGGGAPSPTVGPFLVWPNGWMHQDVTWHGGRPQPGDFVFDGNPAPRRQKGGRSPTIFSPCLLRPNGRMHQDATWHGGRPQPRGLCIRWAPSSRP